MWLLASLVASAVLLTCTRKGRQVIYISKVLLETLRDNLNSKATKNTLRVSSFNGVKLVQYDNITLNTMASHQHYDVKCFESDSKELLEKHEIHNHNSHFDIKQEVPITFFRTGSHLCTVPFRPIDFRCDTLFVSIKHMNQDLYSVYRFCDEQYVNLLDIIDKYEYNLKNNKVEAPLAEAFDE